MISRKFRAPTSSADVQNHSCSFDPIGRREWRLFASCVFCDGIRLFGQMIRCDDCLCLAHPHCVESRPLADYRRVLERPVASTDCTMEVDDVRTGGDPFGRSRVATEDVACGGDYIVMQDRGTQTSVAWGGDFIVMQDRGTQTSVAWGGDFNVMQDSGTQTSVATSHAASGDDTVSVTDDSPTNVARSHEDSRGETINATDDSPTNVARSHVMESDIVAQCQTDFQDVVTEDIDSESDAVPFVLPVMEVNRAQDLNRTFKQWEGRYALFTRFNEGIIADRDTLYSGPPEVLAKYIASRCRSMETVLDPFCGSGAIAIQLAMLGRKVTAMDRDPAVVKCARNNASVYGVADRIRFVVGDFFAIWETMERVDGIVTSPPELLGKRKTGILMRITSRLAPKVLLKFPTNRDKTVLHRMGSCDFQRVKIETISVDRTFHSINVYLGPVKNNGYHTRISTGNEAAQRIDSDVLLFTDGVTVNRRVQWIRGNNLFAYEEYVNKVEDFIRLPTAD